MRWMNDVDNLPGDKLIKSWVINDDSFCKQTRAQKTFIKSQKHGDDISLNISKL